MVTMAKLKKLKVSKTGVAGTKIKRMKEKRSVIWAKTTKGSFFVSPLRLSLLVEKVLVNGKMNARNPKSPVVVRTVKSSFDELEKRMFQRGVKFKFIGLSLVKAVRKVPGPVPKRAVRAFLKMSTAIDQPADRGRSIKLASGVEGKRKLIWKILATTRIVAAVKIRILFNHWDVLSPR